MRRLIGIPSRRRRRRRSPLLLLTWLMMWLLVVVVVVVVDDQKVNAIVLLCKTKETFKLSELQYLELSIQSKILRQRQRQRQQQHQQQQDDGGSLLSLLLIDQATGSSLFRIEFDKNIDDDDDDDDVDLLNNLLLNYENNLPSSLKRCDWIAKILIESSDSDSNDTNINSSIQDFLNKLRNININKNKIFKPMWTLDYIKFVDFNNCRQRQQLQKMKKNKQQQNYYYYTMKSILCCISQAIPTIPALDPNESKQQLMFIDTTTTKTKTTTRKMNMNMNNCNDDDNDNYNNKKYQNKCFLVEKLLLFPSSSSSESESESESESSPIIIQHHQKEEKNKEGFQSTKTKATNSNNNNINNNINNNNIIIQKWPKRPFQYSSAININIADIVIALLDDMVDFDNFNYNLNNAPPPPNNNNKKQSKSKSTKTKTILDPTCGSGTFLAFAMQRDMFVIGYDYNQHCVNGTIRNLQYLFGSDNVQKMAHIQYHDSSSSSSSIYGTSSSSSSSSVMGNMNNNNNNDNNDKNNNVEESILSSSTNNNNNIDCVVANLPWGKNSIEYYNENRHILQSVRTQIPTGIPCAFITRVIDDDSDGGVNFFESCGYKVLEQAHIPQRGFILPKTTKKGKMKKKKIKKTSSNIIIDDNDDSDDEAILNENNNICVVTIARSS